MKKYKSIRQKNIKRLGIEGIVNLPEIDEISIRKKDDIALRAVVLAEIKAITVYPEDKDVSMDWIKENEIDKFLTNSEKTILNKKSLNEQEMIDFSWYQESLYALLWALNIVQVMSPAFEESNVVNYLEQLPPDINFQDYIKKCKLRDTDEILEELDYYYLLHWSIRNKKQSKFELSIVIERRRALEWVINNKLDWDDITLDT